MGSRTETDNQLLRVALPTPVLKQVLPQRSGSALPRWVVDRELLIGRDVDPDRGIALPDDGKASKQHALVRPSGNCVEIKDCNSKNHTFVNGQKVSSTLLDDGDVIRIGSTLFVLRMERIGISDAPKSERVLHDRLLGQSSEICEVRRWLSQAASLIETVLLIGPTGVGKELAAAAVHGLSARSSRPLISINCAAITAGTAESALFGHKRGAFTSAERDHDGYFKQADTGTLFLDEIGELSLEMQAKLLRALQPADPSRIAPAGRNLLRIQPVGSQGDITVDVRIIAATNVELTQAAGVGRFRADLFQRLSVLPVRLPALAARREDLLILIHHYLNRDSASELVRRVSSRLGELLLLYSWPGNVREVVNLTKQLLAFAPSQRVVDLEVIPDEFLAQLMQHNQPASDPAEHESVDAQSPLTKDVLVRLLQENDGLIARVARLLGRSPRQIRRRMDQFGLSRPLATAGKMSAETRLAEQNDDEDADEDAAGS